MKPSRREQAGARFAAVGHGCLPVDVAPILRLMDRRLRAHDYVRMDAARTWIPDGPNDTTAGGRMFVRIAGPRGRQVVVFDYEPKSGSSTLQDLLHGASGSLQSNGSNEYSHVASRLGLVQIGCWSHCRRLFLEALESIPESARRARAMALRAVHQIEALYEIEREAQSLSPTKRADLRRQKASAVLDRLHSRLSRARGDCGGSPALLRASAHCLRQWTSLTHYLNDGSVYIDTGAADAAIRLFSTGRAKWLYAASAREAVSAAQLYGLFATAQINGLDPHVYLRQLFDTLPAARTARELKLLLPFARGPSARRIVVEGRQLAESCWP